VAVVRSAAGRLNGVLQGEWLRIAAMLQGSGYPVLQGEWLCSAAGEWLSSAAWGVARQCRLLNPVEPPAGPCHCVPREGGHHHRHLDIREAAEGGQGGFLGIV
jgi:hypothetical protein